MHRCHRRTAAAILAVPMLAAACGLAAPAFAQPQGGGGMMGAGPQGMMADGSVRYGNPALYLDGLKTRLKITPAQEPAWDAYAETVKGATQQMQGVHETMFQAMDTATWEERRDMMNTMFQARQQAMTLVHDAAQTLLPKLTPAQRDLAATSLPGLVGPGQMGRGRGWRGGPGAGGMGPNGMGPNGMGPGGMGSGGMGPGAMGAGPPTGSGSGR